MLRFPSPCGVNIVGNRVKLVLDAELYLVSVPLRGKYCREFDTTELFGLGLINSFRPLAG